MSDKKTKPVYHIRDLQLVPALSIWPDRVASCEGKFVATGIAMTGPIEDLQPGGMTRTSLLVNVNIEEGYVETLNSIYRIVP